MTAAFDVRAAGQTAIRTVGSVLPADVFDRILAGELDGLSGDDYHLELGLTPREAANRAWSVLTGAWAAYRDALAQRPAGDPATGLTREKWEAVLLRELGYGSRIPAATGGLHADGRTFPVSHCWDDHVPIHLLGWDVPLDRPTKGLPGAAGRAPHAMVQELLNRSEPYTWALLTNGSRLRLLRDSTALVGQAYVEFDLEAIFDGEVFADFALLYLVCHQSRLEPLDPANRADCWLERWRTAAAAAGVRALGQLRAGVRQAIETLGTGFASHPANTALRAGLDTRTLTVGDYHRSLLRLVYRLLFCFVAEDRGLLLEADQPDDTPRQRHDRNVRRDRYRNWFSTARLRRMAGRNRGGRHHDLWQALSLVLDALGNEAGQPALALPSLGGLFETGPADVTAGAQLANHHLLAAIRQLAIVTPPGGGPPRWVDYANLGAEELGGIYESLLEFVPRWDPAERRFTLTSLVGNERKTSGAYYTPTSLTDSLLDTALDPLLDQAERADDPAAALLAITVCDPACGSGHFLVAAARRLAARLANIRAGDAEPSVLDSQAAMHDVVAHCIYGVDTNPLAAELAKVSLWLEALQPGQPLSHLDGHIKVGNSLLGTTTKLLADGIPDDAYTAIEGDDRRWAATLKRRNQTERAGQTDLFTGAGIHVDLTGLAGEAAAIDALPAATLAQVHLAAQRQRQLEHSPQLRRARLVADAWCASFLSLKQPDQPAITHATLRRLRSDTDRTLDDDATITTIERIATEYQLFHWHLEFPQVFDAPRTTAASAKTGFSCLVGNPPWERIKLQEQEFFAARDAAVAEAPTAAVRKKLIKALKDEHPELHDEYLAAKRHAEGESHLLRNSGRYPLCGRGDINTYAVFAENDRDLLAGVGRLGIILPTGIATDATTQHFFRDIVTTRTLASLYDFENAQPLFEGVHRSFKFCLLTLTGRDTPVETASFAFFAHHPADLPARRFTLTPDELLLLNPNTGTCPVFRSRRDAELTLSAYRRHPVLLLRRSADGNNPWGITFMRMLDMANDSDLFATAADLEAEGWELDGNAYVRDSTMLPLYEAKMVNHYDHRWATYDPDGTTRDMTPEEHDDPAALPLPRYWVDEREVTSRLAGKWKHDWLLGFRNITNTTNERTVIAAMIPAAGVGNSMPVLLASARPHLLAGLLSSFAVDYVMRQKLGGTNMNFFYVEQLPIPAPETFDGHCPWDATQSLQDWFGARMVELVHTADDTTDMAAAFGDDGRPFRWDPERRAQLRAELDAAVFQMYGYSRDDVDYILGTFPIVARHDFDRHSEERTRRLVLDAFDGLASAAERGQPFRSPLVPAPGDGPRHS